MRNFDFYEFACILTPGTIALFGIARVCSLAQNLLANDDFSFGDFGLFIVLSYGVGHLVQGIGNLAESLWWRAWGGWPTDWLHNGKHQILGPKHSARVLKYIAKTFSLDDLKNLSHSDWKAIVTQMRTSLVIAGRNHHLDDINGNYGLSRGIAAALFVVLVSLLVFCGADAWRLELLALCAIGFAVRRMHHFGCRYAQELFMQFLALKSDRFSAASGGEISG